MTVDPVVKICSLVEDQSEAQELDLEDDESTIGWEEEQISGETDSESLLSDSEEEVFAPADQIRGQEIGIISGIKVFDITKICRRERWRNNVFQTISSSPLERPSADSHKGLVSYGLKRTLEMVNGGAVRVVTISDASESLENLLTLPDSFKKESALRYFQKSWAKRVRRKICRSLL